MQASFCDHCGNLSLTRLRVGRELISTDLAFDVCSSCEKEFMALANGFVQIRSAKDLRLVVPNAIALESDIPPVPPPPSVPDLTLADWCTQRDLSARVYNVLVKAGDRDGGPAKVSHLLELTPRTLLKIHGLGRSSLNEIVKALQQDGYSLSETE